MILGVGYASPSTRARRQAATKLDRVGGIDGNVSNLSVVSLPDTLDPVDGDLTSSRVELTEAELAALAGRSARLGTVAGRWTGPGARRTTASTGRRSGSTSARSGARTRVWPSVR